jgi:luciferase-type oxidoreductase
MFVPNSQQPPNLNPGYRKAFKPGKLTFGLFIPIEAYSGDEPTMSGQVELAQYAENNGFSSLLFRDVPLRDPTFGDNGQVFDIWTYLGFIAAQTKEIALLTGAVVLPLRHPLHTAKAAASIDRLSNGRLLLGVASGDREIEFPAFGVNFESRGDLFRENIQVMKDLWENQYPNVISSYGILSEADVVPKPIAARPPILITGYSQQSFDWIADNSDGWITYPRNFDSQSYLVKQWRELTKHHNVYKPFSQSYLIDLADDANEGPTPIRLGHRLGRNALIEYLSALHSISIDHIIFNLKYGNRTAKEVIQELCEDVLPLFA